jgi:carboxylesterase type B
MQLSPTHLRPIESAKRPAVSHSLDIVTFSPSASWAFASPLSPNGTFPPTNVGVQSAKSWPLWAYSFTYSTVYNDATGTNYALESAPECLQPPGNGSTDCLFLNIWTTSLPCSRKALKPVMVYIYGGGFTTGSTSNPTNDGGNLAARGDVIVVDIAYRLGALGTLAFNDGVHNGNYWISDQVAGLKWVQQHIADFGGDPSKVTIFGESAGAQSVQALTASSKARGLFRAAILQSTYVDTYLPIPQSVTQFTLPILKETGCAKSKDQLACLRSYNATALTVLPTSANAPTIDGTYLVTPFIDLNATAIKKTTSSVPIMIGVNRDEAGVLNPQPTFTNLTASFYNLNTALGIQSPPKKVIAAALASGEFPLGPGPSLNNTLRNRVFNATTRFYTDYQLKCLSEYVAYTGVATGVWPQAWFYEFNRT